MRSVKSVVECAVCMAVLGLALAVGYGAMASLAGDAMIIAGAF